MYPLLRNCLFALSPETSHHVSLDLIGAAERLKLTPYLFRQVHDPVELMGLQFKNPVGLAAGLDKNGDYIAGLGALGFGFIEVGTVTPRPQPGNPSPRLFRITEREAIINRMGFNNKGVDHLVKRIRTSRYDGILGVNIGKNFDTPVENAIDDYRICFQKVYEYADYVVINISSPNTPGLRSLQFGEALDKLLQALKQEQQVLDKKHLKYVPLVLKIAPDMTDEEVSIVAEKLITFDMDGVIATNTTIERPGVERYPVSQEAGGLSGAPVFQKSTEVLRRLSEALDGKCPIIGVGGISEAADAVEKIRAGSSLVQIYTGFIYHGPSLVSSCAQAIKAYRNGNEG
ncbi:MAG: quinone-dependent dihydroorotate dehydrogenase [Ketobacteraceae bacterium]|nr:quinone-dependent dihydroorotate dehydrogenase [Ketobacteraceae bacterium]